MSYIYVMLSVILTACAQVMIKWQVNMAGGLPYTLDGKLRFVLKLLANPWIIGAFAFALIAALSWMVALAKLDLSYAYPFVGISFALVLMLSAIMFHEPVTWSKIIGIALIAAGVVVSSHGG